jgi:sulfite reductase alpha subunit-like flavoprotein
MTSQADTPFRLLAYPATPLILGGPGAGLAPFRACLQERAAPQTQGQRPIVGRFEEHQ